MTLLALSFHGTHVNTVQPSWKKRKHLAEDGSLQDTTTIIGQAWCEQYAGGTFVILDWERDEVVWQIAIDGVTGFCWHDDALYLNLMRFGETVVLNGYGREVSRFSHRSINNLHTIVPTQRGFLLTSTGTDSIVEVDQHGTLLYEWCALDYGYDMLPNGQRRVLDRSLDQRTIVYLTSTHTTHLNSARYLDAEEQVILATLFHQGTVITIEKSSGQTQTLLSGLKNPHDIRPYPDGGWVVSDTRNNQALLLNQDWSLRERFTCNFDWVQASAPLSDGSIVIADSNNHRLARVHPDHPRHYTMRNFPPDWRIYQVEEVPPAYNGFFQFPIEHCPL